MVDFLTDPIARSDYVTTLPIKMNSATETTAVHAITIEKVGRRHYLVGNTFEHKDAIKLAGCSWDGDRRQWWTGKADVAERLLERLNSAPVSTALRGAPTMLRSGVWGVRVFSTTAKVGDKVTVTARGGKSWDAIVDSVESIDGDTTICSTRKAASSQPASRQVSGSRHSGRCRASGCGAPAVRDGYCWHCHFDEFDN